MDGYWQNYIDGKWVDGGDAPMPVADPATGQPFAQ